MSEHDTPTQRATINQLSVDALDAQLQELRERRLVIVQRLEAAAKVKSDDTRLTSWLSFEKSYMVAKRYLVKLDESITKAEELIHKVRLKAMVVNFEVEAQADDSESTGPENEYSGVGL